jgi:predicted lactoylglutathione lyase
LAHIGWELPSREDVDDVATTLQRIGWPIVYGPASVDGSYLVHFRGPDEAVHDVFYVERQP